MTFLAKMKDCRRDKRKFKKPKGNIKERLLCAKSLKHRKRKACHFEHLLCCAIVCYSFLIAKGDQHEISLIDIRTNSLQTT